MKHLKNRYLISMILLFFFIAGAGIVSARDLKVSMAALPNIIETPDKGVYIDLIKALDEIYTEGEIQRGVFPPPRSLDNVLSGKADFQLPMMRNKVVPEESLPFTYTTEKIGDVSFVIYSHKDNPFTFDDIQKVKNTKPFPLKIEALSGIHEYFDFPIEAAVGVENSLKKVDKKRIDAFIMSQEESDFVIKQFKLKNIHREQYDNFEDVFVIPKGDKGKEIDSILSSIIVKLRSQGKLKELYEKIHMPYKDWQPHEMGW